MKVQGKVQKTIWWVGEEPPVVEIIDQRQLPHRFEIVALRSLEDAAIAIRDMLVRGAPLIGATAACGMVLAHAENKGTDFMQNLSNAARVLKATRPTAVNLAWAVDNQLDAVKDCTDEREAASRLMQNARRIIEDEEQQSKALGQHGMKLIEDAYQKNGGERVNVLTHCNAGWLACVDYGTATAPIYAAHDKGIPVHVWVDETRPRNQGASLTAWELGNHGVSHTVIPDNTGGHLMQHGMVDLAIVGTDRTTRCGDVANKIGTYLKALAAKDNGVPFYVALTSSAFDWNIRDGIREIPIEQRDASEVRKIRGLTDDGRMEEVLLTPESSPAANYGFDVTPARLVTGLITERGICRADEQDILRLFPEKKV